MVFLGEKGRKWVKMKGRGEKGGRNIGRLISCTLMEQCTRRVFWG